MLYLTAQFYFSVLQMEVKVWVEGIQRVVCGVSDVTTCQDIVIALAHATGKTGRFTLVERWRENERLVAPGEHPLKVRTKGHLFEKYISLKNTYFWG